jgi:hypothetical protein
MISFSDFPLRTHVHSTLTPTLTLTRTRLPILISASRLPLRPLSVSSSSSSSSRTATTATEPVSISKHYARPRRILTPAAVAVAEGPKRALRKPSGVPVDRGVSIDRKGRLSVTSRAEAEKECRTALIVAGASTDLCEDDFTRCLPLPEMGKHRGGYEGDGGSCGLQGMQLSFYSLQIKPSILENIYRLVSKGLTLKNFPTPLAIIPGRDSVTLEKLPYWILLFSNPYRAAVYQSRLLWYHQNAVANLPLNALQAAQIPGRGLDPPPGYIDPDTGQDVWRRLREYSVLQPSQEFSVTALMERFPRSVGMAVERHERWVRARSTCRRGGSSGRERWRPRWMVLMRIIVAFQGQDSVLERLGVDRVLGFLEEDGRARKRPWRMAAAEKPDGESPTEGDDGPVFEERYVPGDRGDNAVAEVQQLFGVRFITEGEAMRFWRTWHLRRLPLPLLGLPGHVDMDPGDARAPLLHLELTW